MEKLKYDQDNIIDSFYSKTNNLLFVSNGRKIIIIKIDPINLLIQKRIQTIYIDRIGSFSLLEINKNLLLAYDTYSIFLYQKINGIKTYELRAKLTLIIEYDIHLNDILKLDNKTIIMVYDYYFYLIDIIKMKKKKFRFNKNIKYNKGYIYLLDNKIYICSYYCTYIFEYINNKLFLIDIVYLTDNFVLNYLINKSLEKSFPNSEFKLFLSMKGIYDDVYNQKFHLNYITIFFYRCFEENHKGEILNQVKAYKKEMKYLAEINNLIKSIIRMKKIKIMRNVTSINSLN